MAEDQSKKTTASASSSGSIPTPPPAQSTPKVTTAPAAKGPMLSRRAFLIGALGASALLTAGAFAQSSGILNPLIPNAEPPTVIANAPDLESKYQYAASNSHIYDGLDTLQNGQPVNPKAYYSQFFYWPYTASASPYFNNIIVRLPDDQYLGQQPTSEQYIGSTFTSTPVTSPTGGRFVAFNTTCVHLQCLVNPGYAGAAGSGQFRLICPCHGSQYNLVDAVPVAGPAHDLGLNPLPKVQLSIDSAGNITATSMSGDPGIGRTGQ